MKISDVLSFSEVYASIKDQPMGIKTAYKFSKLAHKLEEETKFYHEKLQNLVDQYVEKDENGMPVYTEDRTAMKIIAGKEEECSKAMNELQNLEVEIAPSFTIDELEGISLTPAQMQGLYPFIIED